ncbi:MAG: hypothetical protein ACYCQJ_16380 [Nitrososphaerales archaeon]
MYHAFLWQELGSVQLRDTQQLFGGTNMGVPRLITSKHPKGLELPAESKERMKKNPTEATIKGMSSCTFATIITVCIFLLLVIGGSAAVLATVSLKHVVGANKIHKAGGNS